MGAFSLIVVINLLIDMQRCRLLSLIARNNPKCNIYPSKYFSQTSSLSQDEFLTAENVFPPVTHFSEDEKSIQLAVEKFAQDRMKPLVKEMDEKGQMDQRLIDELFSNGFMGIEIPTDYGGVGSSFFASILAVEEVARVDPSVAILVDIHNTLITTVIMQRGTEEQKKYWLPKLASDTVGSFCLSEESSGSDAFAMKTVAKPDGQGNFVLNGTKLWISNSEQAGLFVVFANADPSQGYKGITAFLIPKDTPGLSIGKKEDKMCIRASSTCPLHLENVKVSKDQVLGEVGQGYRYCIEILNEGRIGIGARMIGLCRGAFDCALPYLYERKQFGQSIWNFQAMQHQVAEMATKLEAAKLLTYNAARLREGGHNCVKEAAMAKYYSAEVAGQITSKCIEWMGGVGITRDYAAEKFYRDAKIGAIYEGTANIQLNTIAKFLDKW